MSLPRDEELQDRWEAGFALGYSDGVSMRREKERIAAFGAIRRAAEVARRYDSVWMNATDPHWSFVDHYGSSADAIRSAIRAAIGSDNA